MIVDEFQADLAGLFLAEAEFKTLEHLAVYPSPDFVTREVTFDQRYTGGHLVMYGLPR
jgi:CYTH domain-containing protein